jgi:hypothetical protein
MSADIKARYGTSNQAITITINSLASSATAGRASTAVDNSSNLFLDALVTVKISFPNLAVANDQAVYVYAYGTSDGGTTYTGAITRHGRSVHDGRPHCTALNRRDPDPYAEQSVCWGAVLSRRCVGRNAPGPLGDLRSQLRRADLERNTQQRLLPGRLRAGSIADGGYHSASEVGAY